jgi:hypothetical protein
MSEERQNEQEREPSVADKLEEWREAERDEAASSKGSAAQKMAHKRTERAREEFHEREQAERERHGKDPGMNAET